MRSLDSSTLHECAGHLGYSSVIYPQALADVIASRELCLLHISVSCFRYTAAHAALSTPQAQAAQPASYHSVRQCVALGHQPCMNNISVPRNGFS